MKAIADAKTPEDRKDIRDRADLRIDALGSGSDCTVFLDHLGIASLDLSFGDEDGGGIYHSIYDDFYWYTHFADTDFSYGRTLSQTAGTAVMRLADADLLPYNFTDFADTIHRYLDELQKLSESKRDEAIERNLEIEEGVFTATADPKKIPFRLRAGGAPASELRAPAECRGCPYPQRGALSEGTRKSQRQRRTGGEPGRIASAQPETDAE